MNASTDWTQHVGFFSSNSDFLVQQRKLPHWSQPGTACFITFRTCDSIPSAVVQRWMRERAQWLRSHQIDWRSRGWIEQVASLSRELRQEFRSRFLQVWDNWLDDCHGDCVLRVPELSQIVADSMHYFDGERYDLSDYVVMPNHVHLLAAFRSAELMLRQCESWKKFTALQINRQLGRRGRFWQCDGFDHLVRSPEQFDALRRYISNNPVRAKLKPTEFRHYSREFPRK